MDRLEQRPASFVNPIARLRDRAEIETVIGAKQVVAKFEPLGVA